MNTVVKKIKLATKTIDSTSLTFLDVGCGDGTYELMLKREYDYLIGLDVAIDNMKMAKEHVEDKKNVEFILADARYLPFKDFSVDVVLCSEVLEHLYEPSEALSELSRIFRKTLLLTVPVLNVVRYAARILRYNRKLEEIEMKVGHVSMHNSQWWIRTICGVNKKRRSKCNIKADYWYISAAPSLFIHLKKEAIFKIVDISLNVLERILSRPMLANQLIITLSA